MSHSIFERTPRSRHYTSPQVLRLCLPRGQTLFLPANQVCGGGAFAVSGDHVTFFSQWGPTHVLVNQESID